jgi:uncharacterized protein (TIGR02246 family)
MATEQQDAADVAAGLIAAFSDAWNRHDAEALAHVFREDAGFVDVRGELVRGRTEIQRRHEIELAGALKESVLRSECIDARLAAPDVIVAHMRTELHVAGQTRAAIATLVLQQRAGQWAISEAHNSMAAS